MNDNNVTNVVLFSTRKIHERFGDSLEPCYSQIFLDYFTKEDRFPELKSKLIELFLPSETAQNVENTSIDDFNDVKQRFVNCLHNHMKSINNLTKHIQNNSDETIPDYYKEFLKAENNETEAKLIKEFQDFISLFKLQDTPEYTNSKGVFDEFLSVFEKNNISYTSVSNSAEQSVACVETRRGCWWKRMWRRRREIVHKNHPAGKIDITYNEEFFNQIKDEVLGASANELNRKEYHCIVEGDSILVKDRLGVFIKKEKDCAVCAIYSWYGDFEENHKELWENLLINTVKELFPKVKSLYLVLHDLDLYEQNKDEIVYYKENKELINVSLAVFMHNNLSIMKAMDKNNTPQKIVDDIDLYMSTPKLLFEVDQNKYNQLAHQDKTPKNR